VSLELEFKENWSRRNSIEPETVDSLHSYWDAEENLYYLIISVESLESELKQVLSCIEEIDGVAVYPQHFLHITVKLFPNGRPEDNEIEKVLENFEPFKISFGELNLFPQVVFLECLAEEVRDMNKAFSKEFEALEHDGEEYMPHLSLGRFKRSNWSLIVDRVESIREDFNASSLEVDEILLARDVKSVNPRFEVVDTFSLE